MANILPETKVEDSMIRNIHHILQCTGGLHKRFPLPVLHF